MVATEKWINEKGVTRGVSRNLKPRREEREHGE